MGRIVVTLKCEKCGEEFMLNIPADFEHNEKLCIKCFMLEREHETKKDEE